MNFFNCILLLLLGLVPFTGSAAIVEGTVPFPGEVKIGFSQRETGYANQIVSTRSNPDGSFLINVPISQPVVAYLSALQMDRISLFLLPDDTLKVDIFIITDDSFEVEFKGKRAAANQMLREEKRKAHDKAYYTIEHCQITDPAATYYDCKKPYFNFMINRYESIWANADVHPILKSYIYSGIIYGIANDKILFPMFNAYNNKLESDSGLVDPDFYDFLDTVPIEDPKALDFQSYRSFTGYYVQNYIFSEWERKGFKYDKDSLYPILFDITDSVFQSTVGCYQKTQLIERALAKGAPEYIQSRYEKLLEDCAGTPYAERAKRNYQKVVMLKPGNLPPAIIAPTVDNDTFDLSAYTGKTVVLDFWASWCVPCILDISNFRSHQEELLREGVVFIYISIDENEEQWKNAIEQLEIKGIHLRVNGWKAPIAEAYNISGIPQTYLIDKEGKIADPTPPRDPDELEEEIRALMK